MTEPRIVVQTMVLNVRVNFGQEPTHLIKATGRNIFGHSNFAFLEPYQKLSRNLCADRAERRVVLFPVDLDRAGDVLKPRYAQDLYEKRKCKLEPVDPYTLAVVNTDRYALELLGRHPTFTQWWTGHRWCQMLFSEHDGEQRVQWETRKNILADFDRKRVYFAGFRE